MRREELPKGTETVVIENTATGETASLTKLFDGTGVYYVDANDYDMTWAEDDSRMADWRVIGRE